MFPMPSSRQCLRISPSGVASPRIRPLRCTWDLTELLPALTSSVITTSYTLQAERLSRSSKAEPTVNDAEATNGALSISTSSSSFWSHVPDFVVDPPPSIMLMACLVLGCSVSSFVYRRQDRDPAQAAVFLVFIIWAVVLGRVGLGASANLVMLGCVPWALCAAMPASAAVHHIGVRLKMRRLAARRTAAPTAQKDESEKAKLVTMMV